MYPQRVPADSHRSRPRRWRRVVWAVLACLALALASVYLAYARDVRATRDRLSAGSRIVVTSHGPVEYAVRGVGPPILVIHGSGGGYDQGLLLAKAFGGGGFRWIAPSRFGYLRSPLPADASTAAQADAFAELLDSLGIQRVGVLAMSGGVPPALQLAVRHPGCVSSLALLSSAPYTPLKADEEKRPVPVWVYQALFSSDLPYWVLQKVAGRGLERMFDVTPALRATLTPEELDMLAHTVESFQPVTARIAGVRNEGAAIDPRATYRLEDVAVPTLVIHAADDKMNPLRVGEYTVAHIRGAELVRLAGGGHLLMGHHAEIRARVNAFLRRYSPGAML